MHNEQIITGFHAIEEKVRSLKTQGTSDAKKMHILFATQGPRIKKIVEQAKGVNIPCTQTSEQNLNKLTEHLSEAARDHRGIVLQITGAAHSTSNNVNFDEWIYALPENENITVVILDSITDVHNVGAILRSCDQFGASLVLLPNSRSASNIQTNEIIARSSAGSNAWVPFSVVPNLVRCVQQLKDAGFWVYGADAGGEPLHKINFAQRRVIVMGSEGSGISHLLSKQCDQIVSIPTCGKIDSLNVSVAAGVLLYELYRRNV